MSSSQIETLSQAELASYGPTARRFFLRAKEERVPLAGGIELTHRCNLSCLHCYVNLPAGDREARRREMTTGEVFRVVDELAELGTIKLTLTGGEPLLRRDFEEIYRHAHGKGILVVVYTNATLIGPEHIALWKECPPAKIEVTQYGATADTFNAVAGDIASGFSRFEQGLEQLDQAKVRFSLKTVAMRRNAHEVRAMRRLAASRGVDFRFDTVISPRIDGGAGPLAQRLPPAEAALLDFEEGAATAEQWADYCHTQLDTSGKSTRWYRCGAGAATFLIDPYGRLHVCELSRRPGWDVLQHGFSDGWYRAVPELVAEPAPPGSTCHECPTEAICQNCAGMSELERKAVDPYLCQLTDERNRLGLGDERPRPLGLVPLGRRTVR